MDLSNLDPLGTVAQPVTEEDKSALPYQYVTFSSYVDQHELYQKIAKTLGDMERAETLQEADLKLLSEQVHALEKGTAARLECEYRLQSLRRKHTRSKEKTVNSSQDQSKDSASLLVQVNQASTVTELENALIELGHTPYINLGQKGRRRVANEILQEQLNFRTLEELTVQLDTRSNRIRSILEKVNQSTDVSTIESALKELDIAVFNSLPPEKQQKVSKYFLENRKRRFPTISLVESELMRIIMEQNIYATEIPIDFFTKH